MPPSAFDRKRFGAAVRRARQDADLTQAALAEAAGVTDETVSRLERGAFEPSLSTAVAVARALGVPVDSLVNGGGVERSRGVRTPDVSGLERLPPPARAAVRRLIALLAAPRRTSG